ncbi:hypothetical protein PQ472_03955 [Lacticaseibacillus pabuli]|uniref:Membrane protein YfhO n=1 Tax=Lacticaseibacillus pabuli TaxID=3025672 RepID=A0ABY7WUG0_9LACO|nr:hypothetical protein [Lacticaseibacillus sp. KACC 23028]WDF83404.1 hypothetical protein PQ472_03955 [Lacticaseibacillus sp. KACC 23028]
MHALAKKIRTSNAGPVLIILLVSLGCTLPQLFNHSLILGVDSIFHLNRFYEAAMQLQHHDLSYFQSNYAFQQSGRIVTALYGPYLTYLIGGLLLALGSWLKLELVLVFLIETIAGLGMFMLARRVRANRFWSLMAGLVYMLAGWVPTWITTQEFMAWGAALMPWVLIFGIKMVQDHEHPVHVLGLALTMAALMQTHTLSSVLVTLALIPLAVLGFVQAKRRWKMVGNLLLSVLIALALTANVWGALLEVYGGNLVMAPYMPLNSGTFTSKLSFGSYGRGTLGGSLGIVCTVIVLAQVISIFLRKQRDALEITLTATGTAFMIAASSFVPWNRLVDKWNQIGSYLQFPSRFATVGMILLLAAFALNMTKFATSQPAKVKLGGRNWATFAQLGMLMGVMLLAFQTYTDAERSAEAWNKPQVLQSGASITLSADDMTEVRDSFMSKNLGSGLQMVAKGTPDYLPVPRESWRWFQDNSQYRLYHDQLVALTTAKTAEPGQIGKKIDKIAYKLYNQLLDEASPYALYYYQITSANKRFTKKVLKGGTLQVTWHAKKKGVTQVPVVIYKHTHVVLNGKVQKHSNFERSDIGAIITAHRKGTNVLTIHYEPARSTIWLLRFAPIAWLLTILAACGEAILRWRRHVREIAN